eukprot:CAMPEP_0119377418 /NCGR_PEP_ID=MMETSP1334-20130426/44763_1 /TAXON_ID=127549 /ORGANISM="Calcidiscus leptoporus, Strain RCC1130" /LENGTH=172 /DNA_ID=CAMNT_0007396327 /DNA_START=155 /DNA_END=673 /DNA_ORIENTATION=-
MLGRKAFKGGNLDDFLEAGEAEAKYGPKRYAAVSEDAWKIQVEQSQMEAERQRSLEAYGRQKAQLLADHALLSSIGACAMWSFTDVQAVKSFVAGTLFGALYLILKQREADSFGASSLEEVRAGPPPLVAPVLMVLIVGKNKELLLLPAVLLGFFTNIIATVAQAAYGNEDA